MTVVGDLLSPVHLVVLGIIGLLVFGPKRLPELGSGLGQALRGFKEAVIGQKLSERSADPEDAHSEALKKASPGTISVTVEGSDTSGIEADPRLWKKAGRGQ
ncbi:MAG: twin-arginine translocase TatA/TatE family subunit [Thermaerobacter sp.]|nr:twin-arginine translocase TatA/TatE family subunit [Thermaerobacter sp.]